MKTFIVYVNGIESGMIKAASHNAAEKKAREKYALKTRVRSNCFGELVPEPADISVAYTEV